MKLNLQEMLDLDLGIRTREEILADRESKSKTSTSNGTNEEVAIVANLANFPTEDGISDESEDETSNDFIPDSVYDGLPKLLQESCKIFTEKEERDVYLTGALSVLGGCFHNVYAYNSVDKKAVSPNLLSFIVAPAASGKGVLKYSKMLASKIQTSFAGNIQTKSSQPKLIIPANVSTSGLIELLNQNQGVGIIVESEIDTLISAHKQEWGNYSDILRQSFENESSSFYRKTDKQHAVIDQTKLSLAISGTPNQFKQLMKSAENGLFSRGCYYIFETNDDQLKCFGRFETKKDISQLFSDYSEIADNYYKKLLEFECIKIIFSRSQLSQIQTALQHEFNQIYGFRDMEAIIKRAFVSTQKIATTLSCLLNCENKTIKDESNCLDSILKIAIDLILLYFKHACKAYELLPKNNETDLTVNYQRLYWALPLEFGRKDATDLSNTLGISVKTVDNAIKTFKEMNMIQTVSYGKFKKLIL